MTVNWIDAAILLTFFWFAFTGLTGGLLRSGLTMISFILGVVLAGLFYERLASDIRVIFGDNTAVRIIALVAIFAATALAGQLLAILLKQVAAILFFGPLDSVGGVILGLIKAFVVVELVLIVFAEYRDRVDFMAHALGSSFLAPYFLKDFPFLARLMPHEFRDAVEAFNRTI